MNPRRLMPDRYVEYYLGNAPSLVWLLIINGVLFLVGVQYYVKTMPSVSLFLYPWYADSPTAFALGGLALTTLLPSLNLDSVFDTPQNRPMAYLYTIAVVWMVKFGIWPAVALNIHPNLYIGFNYDSLSSYWGVIASHLFFVVESVLLVRVGRTTRGALALSLVLMLWGDFYDYVLGHYPPIRYTPHLVLPIASVALTFFAVGFAWWSMPKLSSSGREPESERGRGVRSD